ncbi:MAG: OmpA family protein [Deltaproteobacteria bacterium]|nr:OmpA family protein [Deltaproteobacteria bacterium]MBW2398413.1 OmpA family protein [Deltaproteobacteria bacterium]MBW2666557.1 OmpA family protein [Deltaproteobacteria bacterium]
MRAIVPVLLFSLLFMLGCRSGYNNAYQAETQRLEGELARQTGQAQKYVAIVLFSLNSDVIDEAGAREIEWFLEKIAPSPMVRIGVKGYTDSTGSEAQNAPLSNTRAWAVQDYLVSRGVAPERISASGYSASDPARTNTNAKGRTQNRRAEIRVY